MCDPILKYIQRVLERKKSIQLRFNGEILLKNHKLYIKFSIVLFKRLSNSKRRNKGNFTSKSNSNKIKLCGGGGQHYLILNKISTL